MTRWPDSKKAAVVLSFDLDAESLWIARDPKNIERPVIMSQGEYGPKAGIPRILGLLKKYDLKATFFVTGWAIEKYPETVQNIYDEGHEIGHHGYVHERPDTLTIDQEKNILEKGLKLIKEATGEKPLGYRSPAWEFSPNTLRLLRDYKFKYSSNMMNNDLPYRHEIDGKKTDLIELPVHWALDDAPYFLYGLGLSGRIITDPSYVYSAWKGTFQSFYEEGLCYVLTTHPQLIGYPSRIKMLERLITYMRRQPDVWFAKAIDVADYWAKL